jgi:glutathione synthase/RimK-type ligase-like ATP-grasp enzyme
MKIAYVSYQIQEKYTSATVDEDKTLLDFLTNKGLSIERVIWNDPAADWKSYDVAIIKSPWDYHEHITEFKQWLDHLESLNVKLLNPYEHVRWNMDKHYLGEIAASGLAVIPSFFLEKGDRLDLNALTAHFNTEKLIIKPCISAGAKNTFILTAQNLADYEAQINGLLLEEAFLAQPFMPEIHYGEWSFLFFNGVYSHSLLKIPKDGDFRVQSYHGGSVNAQEGVDKHIQSAAAYVEQYAQGCLYARVDGLIVNGELNLMELELIEPYLFLDTHEEASENYYKALSAKL